MGYRIGMDFGTTNSTISYVDRGEPVAFKYPAPEGTEYIPSCVAYDADGVHPGRSALDCIESEEAVFCSNLKMVLPLPEEERRKHGWPEKKPPETAIADYFQRILLERGADSPSFAVQRGEIEGLVLSVPHVWDSMDHPGRAKLQEIVKGLGLPLRYLVSEPQAAAAYFAFRHERERGRAFEGNLLICDMGGGTFDVTLCRVEPGRVVELHNDGNGRRDMGRAGVSFDRRLIREGLNRSEAPFEEDGRVINEMYRRLQEYKANNTPDITKKILAAMEDPDQRERPILRAGKLSLNYLDIQAAFADVAAGISEVLGRFKSAVDARKLAIDAVFFVGGFCQFLLVREEIKKALGLESSRIVADANRETARFAISYGAALLANDLYAVEEKFDHTLGILSWVAVRDASGYHRKEDERIVIIAGGKKLGEYEAVQWFPSPLRVLNDSPQITLFVAPSGGDRIFAEDLPDSLGIRLPRAGLPGRDLWRVGMRIDRSKMVYLVFKQGGMAPVEFDLGDIVRRMFGRPEMIREGRD